MRTIKKQATGVAYEWAAGAPKLAPIDAVVQTLRSIYERDGEILPRTVWMDARTEHSPLHGLFTWDDQRAADLQRDSEARAMMRRIVIVYRDERGEITTPPVRGFAAVSRERPEDGMDETPLPGLHAAPRSYVPVPVIMSEVERRRRYVQQAYADLLSWRRRYEDIAEFAALFDAMEHVARTLDIAV